MSEQGSRWWGVPMMPLRGVLSSWETMDRNSSLTRMLSCRSSISFSLYMAQRLSCSYGLHCAYPLVGVSSLLFVVCTVLQTPDHDDTESRHCKASTVRACSEFIL